MVRLVWRYTLTPADNAPPPAMDSTDLQNTVRTLSATVAGGQLECFCLLPEGLCLLASGATRGAMEAIISHGMNGLRGQLPTPADMDASHSPVGRY